MGSKLGQILTALTFTSLSFTVSAEVNQSYSNYRASNTSDLMSSRFCDKLETITQNIIDSVKTQYLNNSVDLCFLHPPDATTGDFEQRLTSEEVSDNVLLGQHLPDSSIPHLSRANNSEQSENFGKCLKKFSLCHSENTTRYCIQHFHIIALKPRCFNSMESGGRYTDEHTPLDYSLGDDKVGSSEAGGHHPAVSKVWLYGFLCCTAEIILARLGVIVLPLMSKDLYEKLILSMVGLAAGTLTGSAIFHLLPKAFSMDKYYKNDAYLRQCLEIAGGVWLFLVIERTLKIVFFYNERKITYRRGSKLGNVLALPNAKEWQDSISVIFVANQPDADAKGNDHIEGRPVNFVFPDGGMNVDSTSRVAKTEHCSSPPSSYTRRKCRPDPNDVHPIRFQEGSLASVSTEAWMVIFGDGFLDFVDGVSIGTGFQHSILTGFSISLGILLEELPHELGEFAVLLNAGLSFRQALVLKFLSSCTTYLGLALGVWLGGIEAGHIIFALAAGMFLYIALVDMIPELNEAAVKSSKLSVLKGFKVLVLQNLGLLVGMAVIYVMALYEHLFRKL